MSLGREFLRLKWGDKIQTIKVGMWENWKRLTKNLPEERRKAILKQIGNDYFIGQIYEDV